MSSLSATAYKVIYGLGGLVTKGLDKLRAARLRRRSIRELDRLSDHMLADIGLHRGEIVARTESGLMNYPAAWARLAWRAPCRQ